MGGCNGRGSQSSVVFFSVSAGFFGPFVRLEHTEYRHHERMAGAFVGGARYDTLPPIVALFRRVEWKRWND